MPAPYTDAELIAIEGWLRQGLSAAQITHAFCAQFRLVSRNGIIGVVHRNKRLRAVGFKRAPGGWTETQFKQSPRLAGVLTAPKPAPAAPKQPKPGLDAINIAVRRESRSLPPKPLPVVQPMECREVLLTELKRGECRFPVNDPERPGNDPHKFCGLRAQEGRSYCHAHWMLSISKGTESERSAHRFLARSAA